tara:strand:+ start:460 stop:891 length:432 start_codon:yes stop_codon:yes gene_type:complete
MRVEGALRDGIVADWDAAEALMDHSFKSCLGCSPVDHPLLMAEPSFNTPAARAKLTELAFEKFGVPGVLQAPRHARCAQPAPMRARLAERVAPDRCVVAAAAQPSSCRRMPSSERLLLGVARRWCSTWAAAPRAQRPCTTATC